MRCARTIVIMNLLLLIVLIVLLIGALPTWPYSSRWGYYPSGGLGLILVILLLLVLLGRDAADVSVCTAFGIARLSKQEVRCEAVEDTFHALTEHELGETAISLEASKE
jgi:hypothetical protein